MQKEERQKLAALEAMEEKKQWLRSLGKGQALDFFDDRGKWIMAVIVKPVNADDKFMIHGCYCGSRTCDVIRDLSRFEEYGKKFHV